MTRTRTDVIAAMADTARLTAFGPSHTWHDALFSGDDLTRPSDPDRALLAALADEVVEADAHLARVPDALHVEWLERILGLERLPVVPDTVVAHATVDPALAPAVLATGTLLRGGKDAYGVERRYATADALTAHGAQLVAARSQTPGGSGGVVGEAGSFPLDPSDGAPADHRVRIHSEVMRFDGGHLSLRLRFEGAPAPLQLGDLRWRYPRPDGTVGDTTGSVSGDHVTVTLQEACGVPGEPCWIEGYVPDGSAVPTAMTFSGLWLKVTSRSEFAPEAGYYNDGRLDVTKEFQPFGPVAKRGDAFYVRSDEAFSKRLATLTIALSVLSDSGGAVTKYLTAGGIPGYTNEVAASHLLGFISTFSGDDAMNDVVAEVGPLYEYLADPDPDPTLKWQRRTTEWWESFATRSSLSSVTGASIGGGMGSRPTSIGGQEGHYIRAFLSEGDFGWTSYLSRVADFAGDAASWMTTPGPMPLPPTPPIVTEISLTYTTKEVRPDGVESVNGWIRRTKPEAQPWSPFHTDVSPDGHAGMLALGLDIPVSAAGSSVSIYVGVDSAAACGDGQEPDARWEWWDGAAWRPLPVADGTHALRESGLLRFVAPEGWAEGCPRADAERGRWIRLVTHAPDRLGTVLQIVLDAVIAAYVSTAPDPSADPTPQTPLVAGAIKGTVATVPGITKVTNLASVQGRGPETDTHYATRASGIVRHRRRAVTPWDYEQHVAIAFPEVAAVRCLPHTDGSGGRSRGSVGIVVVPDRPDEPCPRPSVSLAGRIGDALAPLAPVHATPTVLCALYAEVTVELEVTLRRGVAALDGGTAIRDALEAWLHPQGVTPTRWGRALHRSALEAFVEHLPVVDAVTRAAMLDPTGTAVDVIEVDACRGLFCSSGSHTIDVTEQL